MTEVEMTVRQAESVSLEITEQISSYADMISVLKAYVNELLASTDLGNENVLFCEELPKEGNENVLYVETTTPKLCIWSEEDSDYVFVGGTSSGVTAGDIEDLTADDEDIEAALNETFGDSGVATDEDIEAALAETFGDT